MRTLPASRGELMATKPAIAPGTAPNLSSNLMRAFLALAGPHDWTQGGLSAVPPDRVQVTAVEFHNALESRHGYGSQTPHSP